MLDTLVCALHQDNDRRQRPRRQAGTLVSRQV